MKLMTDLQSIGYKLFFAIVFNIVLLWFSVFFYCVIYYVYIPAVAHVKPVYLQYETSCRSGNISIPENDCSYPSANISLVMPGKVRLLSMLQSYTVEITLEMPESENNRRQGTLEEKQVLVIPLFEQYIEEYYKPTHFAYIEVRAKNVEVYSSNLRIHAQFTGLRYLMYYWPTLSAIFGIFSIFFCTSFMIIFTWLRFMKNGAVIRPPPARGDQLREAAGQFANASPVDETESSSSEGISGEKERHSESSEESSDSFQELCHPDAGIQGEGRGRPPEPSEEGERPPEPSEEGERPPEPFEEWGRPPEPSEEGERPPESSEGGSYDILEHRPPDAGIQEEEEEPSEEGDDGNLEPHLPDAGLRENDLHDGNASSYLASSSSSDDDSQYYDMACAIC